LELDGADLSNVTLVGITVEGSGGQLGAVAQNGTVHEGWDSDIERNGTIAANDLIFAGELDILGVIGPHDIPVSEELEERGLDALLAAE
jgi:hypothetical protein